MEGDVMATERNPDRLTRFFREAYEAKGEKVKGKRRNVVIAMGVHDPISAVAASTVAHELFRGEEITPWALQISGFGVAGSRLLLPDTGEIGPSELLEGTGAICRAVLGRHQDTLIMADLDHGYGGPNDAAELAGKAIELGIAGFNLEDQQYLINGKTMEDMMEKLEDAFGPEQLRFVRSNKEKRFLKSCGHIGTKKVFIRGRIGGGKVVLPLEMMAEKVGEVAKARDGLTPRHGHVAINARTDVFSTYPPDQGKRAIEDALERGNAYLDAGADIVFYEAVPPFKGFETLEVIQRLIDETDGPTSFNALRGGRTKEDLSADILDGMGAARMSLPIASVEAQVYLMTHAYLDMFTTGTNTQTPTLGFGVTKDFLGWPRALRKMLQEPHEVAKQGGRDELLALMEGIEGTYKEYIEEQIRSM